MPSRHDQAQATDTLSPSIFRRFSFALLPAPEKYLGGALTILALIALLAPALILRIPKNCH